LADAEFCAIWQVLLLRRSPYVLPELELSDLAQRTL
jgi:hypothetical protein